MIKQSYVSKLKNDLRMIEDSLCLFIKKQTLIRTKNSSIAGMMTIAPRISFSQELDSKLRQQQNILSNGFREWEEHFILMIQTMPQQFQKEITNILNYLMGRIELKHDWLIESTIESNVTQIQKNVSFLYEIFSILEETKQGYLFVPDADALILAEGGIKGIAKMVSVQKFDLVVLPSVLDELRRYHNSFEGGTRSLQAKAILDEVKALMQKGSLIDGVPVTKSFKFFLPPVEADFNKTLNWLDRTSLDDRIIASLLSFEHSHQDKIVVLLTDNINLQNKAEMAHIPFIDPQ